LSSWEVVYLTDYFVISPDVVIPKSFSIKMGSLIDYLKFGLQHGPAVFIWRKGSLLEGCGAFERCRKGRGLQNCKVGFSGDS
jgi:hypothetical protein